MIDMTYAEWLAELEARVEDVEPACDCPKCGRPCDEVDECDGCGNCWDCCPCVGEDEDDGDKLG